MIRHLLAGALATCAAVGVARADTQVVVAEYSCERSVTLPVSFITPAGETGYAVMQYENRLITMRSAPTGSGVRYVSMDEQIGYRLYTKGDEAMVAFLAADHTASEQILLKDCRARP